MPKYPDLQKLAVPAHMNHAYEVRRAGKAGLSQ